MNELQTDYQNICKYWNVFHNASGRHDSGTITECGGCVLLNANRVDIVGFKGGP